MYKHYNFHLGKDAAPTYVSMSSTPGWLRCGFSIFLISFFFVLKTIICQDRLGTDAAATHIETYKFESN